MENKKPVIPIPDGYQQVIPYLMVESIEPLIPFLEKAFHGRVKEQIPNKEGTVTHAEVQIGDCVVMIGKTKEGMKAMPSMIYIYMEDTHAANQRTHAASGTSMMEPTDLFYSDRNAGVTGPQGNQWWIATHFEDVSSEDLVKRSLEREN